MGIWSSPGGALDTKSSGQLSGPASFDSPWDLHKRTGEEGLSESTKFPARQHRIQTQTCTGWAMALATILLATFPDELCLGALT